MADYSADYLRRLIDLVVEFEVSFESWMDTQNEGDVSSSRGIFPTVSMKEDADPSEVRLRELEVARTAGAAAQAVRITGAYVMVAGLQQPLDPIANWALMQSMKALVDAHLIRTTAANVRGRLETMLLDAEAATEAGTPGLVPSQLHPLIWTAAADHWTTHQHRVAVREAGETLTAHWRTLLGRADVDGTKFWESTLSDGEPTPSKPKLSWPGDDNDLTVKSMRGGTRRLAKGLADFAAGVNLTIRNVATHAGGELSEQEGLERLAAYSYLARLLDQCEIRRHPEDPLYAGYRER